MDKLKFFPFPSILIFPRKVCAARYSSVLTYKYSNTIVVSGCTASPGLNSEVVYVYNA